MTKKVDVEAIENSITELTKEFKDRLRSIDPELIAQIRVGRGLKLPDGHFSDWHDNWNDKDRWSKTWGKAGEKADFDFDSFEDEFKK
ncbi:hypothetical protein [Saccharospirillum mangrovi]|uniref:hypothetical protein n=1 Tax=Saccharospirillum mangrovi TaxID=2161747 RepID=UPI000D369613|nr:hypothetical protein [Saccharospirillum mangrovi]